MKSQPIREFHATYYDGTQYKLICRGFTEAVLSAQELNKSRLVRVVPVGEW